MAKKRPLYPVRKCPGPCANRTPFGNLCPECHRLLARAKQAFPLPVVPPHPLGDDRTVKDLQEMPEAELDLMVAADGPHEAARRARAAAECATYDRAVDAVIAVLGVDHTAVRTLMRNRPTYRPENQGQRFRESAVRMRREMSDRDRQKQEAQRRSLEERAKRARRYLDDARAEVPPLLAFVDYVQAPDAAAGIVEFAHKHWYSSQRDRTLFHGDGFVADFAGRNACTEACRGWDGTSYRCECGAHRVCWDSEGDFDEPNSYVYARIC